MAPKPANLSPRLGRRAWLRLAALLGGGLALGAGGAPAWAESPDQLLQRRLGACAPLADPLQELLRRNREFAAVWQRAAASGDPSQRAALLLAQSPLRCQLGPNDLAQGQQPWAALLCCADSRLAPEWLFAAGAGELFQVRSAGNTAFPAGVASLEYAVAELQVPLILVLGHSGCGAVRAALGDGPLTPLLEQLVLPIRQALPPAPWAAPWAGVEGLERAVQANARAAAAALPQSSQLLAQALAEGRLRIQPAYLDIGSGLVSLL